MSQEFIKHLLHARHQPGASLRQRQMERFKDLSMSQHRQVSRDIDPAHRRLSSQKGKQMLKCPEQEGQRATSFHVQKTQPHHLLSLTVEWSWRWYRLSETPRGSSKVSRLWDT